MKVSNAQGKAQTVAVPLHRMRDALASGSNPISPVTSYTQVVGLPLGDGCMIPKGSLRYVAPCAGGWGIARGAMQVPESVMLFQSPCACGRHGSVAAYINGYRDRMYYLDISEEDLVMGEHMNRVEDAVERIMETREIPPRAFFLFSTCIDDLLGSDYGSIASLMTERYGIPFVEGHMDPVTMTSSTPPPVKLQRSIYQLLIDSAMIPKRADAVNIIGGFAPVDVRSELFEVLKGIGLHIVHQLPSSTTFDEFLEMRDASYNLLLKPFGQMACGDLRQAFGTPYRLTGMHYDVDRISALYDDLGGFFGRKLAYEPFRADILAFLEESRTWLSGLRVAVGSNLNGSTFEVADVLARAGATISFLVAEEMEPSDLPYIDDLCAQSPDIPVYPGTHPLMSLVPNVPQSADVAIGFDAARLAPSAAPMSLGVDVQPFGYQACRYLIDHVHLAISHRESAKELLYAQTLVV